MAKMANNRPWCDQFPKNVNLGMFLNFLIILRVDNDAKKHSHGTSLVLRIPKRCNMSR